MKPSKTKRTQEQLDSKPSALQMAGFVKAQAHVLQRALERGLSGTGRAKVERQLAKAYDALHPMAVSPSARGGSWSFAAMQRSLIAVVEAAVARIKAGESDEDTEVARVAYQISVQTNAEYAPRECRGRVPSDGDIRVCLESWARNAGKPRAGEAVVPKEEAMLALFKALRIASGDAGAVKKLRQRSAIIARRRT
jgi:hypothetical protein